MNITSKKIKVKDFLKFPREKPIRQYETNETAIREITHMKATTTVRKHTSKNKCKDGDRSTPAEKADLYQTAAAAKIDKSQDKRNAARYINR